MLVLHPLILGQLADPIRSAKGALHGGATTDGRLCLNRNLHRVVETVQGTMHAARGCWGRVFLGAFGRAQGSGHVQRSLGRAQLTRLQRQLVQVGGGEVRRSGRVVGGVIRRGVGNVGSVGSIGGGGGGIGRGRMTVERDVVGSDNVGGHDETHCRENQGSVGGESRKVVEWRGEEEGEGV